MLNLFGSFVVPGVEHVVVYCDDQDQNLFYMVPKYPSVAKTNDGGPAVNLILYGGGSPSTSNEDQGGLLTLTTGLTVEETDQATIQSFIENQYQGVRPVYAGPGLTRFVSAHGVSGSIRLSYPTWIDGNVSLWLFPDVPLAISGPRKPSLIGANAASFSTFLDQNAATLLRRMLTQQGLPGGVNYSVSFLARMPAVSIRVTGSIENIYQEIKQNCLPIDVNGLRYYICPLDQIHDLETLRSTLTTLQIVVSSVAQDSTSNAPLTEAINEQLKDMVFQIVRNYLKNRFFTAAFNSDAESDPGSSAGTSLQASPQASTTSSESWLKKLTQMDLTEQLEFQVTYQSNLAVAHNASRLLSEMLTTDQVRQRTVDVDLSDSFFQVLDVSVQVAVDFATDGLAGINVVLEYSQRDDATGEQKMSMQEYRFTTGQEIFRFQLAAAKDQNGDPKDIYTYRSRILFNDASVLPIEVPPKESRDRTLIIGYDQLSCARVQATWGTVPTDSVQQIKIHFRCPNVNLPSAEKDIVLSPDHMSDSWFTYTGSNGPVLYEYQVSYFLVGGQRVDQPAQHGTSVILVVNAPPEQARSTASSGS